MPRSHAGATIAHLVLALAVPAAAPARPPAWARRPPPAEAGRVLAVGWGGGPTESAAHDDAWNDACARLAARLHGSHLAVDRLLQEDGRDARLDTLVRARAMGELVAVRVVEAEVRSAAGDGRDGPSYAAWVLVDTATLEVPEGIHPDDRPPPDAALGPEAVTSELARAAYRRGPATAARFRSFTVEPGRDVLRVVAVLRPDPDVSARDGVDEALVGAVRLAATIVARSAAGPLGTPRASCLQAAVARHSRWSPWVSEDEAPPTVGGGLEVHLAEAGGAATLAAGCPVDTPAAVAQFEHERCTWRQCLASLEARNLAALEDPGCRRWVIPTAREHGRLAATGRGAVRPGRVYWTHDEPNGAPDGAYAYSPHQGRVHSHQERIHDVVFVCLP